MRREQITIYLDRDDAAELKERARRRGISIGEAAREFFAAGRAALKAEAERVVAQNEAMG